MGSITIASFNIEKNGQSSELLKQTKVSDFIDSCVTFNMGVIYLCEVHSARIEDYIEQLRAVYGGTYRVEYLDGGYSNAYVFMVNREVDAHLSYDGLKGLNRNMFLCHVDNEIAIGFAHFKSGQTGLTRSQLENAGQFMEGFTNNSGKWAITGDMNWDFNNAGRLNMPAGSHPSTCWQDMTQRSGNILDWCAAGRSVQVQPVDGPNFFAPDFQVMDGPDHRPVVFALTW